MLLQLCPCGVDIQTLLLKNPSSVHIEEKGIDEFESNKQNPLIVPDKSFLTDLNDTVHDYTSHFFLRLFFCTSMHQEWFLNREMLLFFRRLQFFSPSDVVRMSRFLLGSSFSIVERVTYFTADCASMFENIQVEHDVVSIYCSLYHTCIRNSVLVENGMEYTR